MSKTAQDRIASLKALKGLTPQQAAEAMAHPTGDDAGIYNTSSGAGIRVRDDGCVELRSGDVLLLLDGQSGQVTISAKRIATVSSALNLHADPGKAAVGFNAINPHWFEDNPEAAAMTADIFQLQRKVMVMQPGSPTPIPIPLDQLLTPVRIFNSQEKRISGVNALKKILGVL